MPETTFTFRVDQELKKAFTEAARARDRPGSQLLRDFMRVYVERAEHDAWFRAEVEQSLKEADDPNVELIPHEEVVRKWKTRGAEWLKKAKRERDHPRRGRPGRVAGTRELVVPGTPYIVVYAVGADYVRIHRVLHGAQRWPPR